MALNSSSARSALASTTRALQQCQRAAAQPISRPIAQSAAVVQRQQRSLSSSSARRSDAPTRTTDEAVEMVPAYPTHEVSNRPRWAQTPIRMKAPFQISVAKDPRRKIWANNEDPDKLDAMYNRLLGQNGESMLPDEIKWLAVTHKSFDQGRRGFNTRLAYFGRQILALETTRSVLLAPITGNAADKDEFKRKPFTHPALANIDKLSVRHPQKIIDKEKLAKLVRDVGLMDVIRWKPRNPMKLETSGVTVVANTALFAIIGAVSLTHGGEVAQRVVRDKILRKLVA
ncbi:ribonuclease-III-like-domain-containing protein [Podospora didyma]|uniref:Ribonuclease-III-like-domain-containing protein n=1 Tax=Podospora didyma TaxID=330526 RepID=A0AAE0KJ21_9PEZI|nr:ribonuclease-III-like-domain-containing protein [Podospora didyma]